MKQFKLFAGASALALLLGAGIASADVVVDGSGVAVKTDGASTKTNLVGSDTLNRVMDCLVNGCSGVTALGLQQINNYQGQGSSQGERQMAGSPNAGTDEPACTVGGASDANGYPETNPGCQEIAPMTREMQANVCEDDITTNGGLDLRGPPNTTPAGQTSVNISAESLAICADGILIVTDNRSMAQTADSAGQCATPTAIPATVSDPTWADTTSANQVPFSPATTAAHGGIATQDYLGAGKLRRSGTKGGYTFGGNSLGWKDVLRVVYTGCPNDGFGVKKTDGTADLTCGSIHRYFRCTSPLRKAVLNDWFSVVEDGAGDPAVKCDGTGGTPNNTVAACASNADGVSGGLRHAFRRDDASGTTGFFLSTLGLNGGVGHRIKMFSGVQNKPVDIPAHAADTARADPADATTGLDSGGNMFCDGGDVEGFILDAAQCTANAANACLDFSDPRPGTCAFAKTACTTNADCTGSGDSCLTVANPFPKDIACRADGACPPAPQVGPAPVACTAGATGVCRDYLKDKNNIATTLACPIPAGGHAGDPSFCPNVPEYGDPITKPCKPEDTLCAWNGRMEVVEAIVSPNSFGNPAVAPYPTVESKRSSIGVPPAYFFGSFDMCPDSDPPPCRQPFEPAGSPGATANLWNVVNEALSRPSTNVDGRAYNPIFNDNTDGSAASPVQCLTGTPAGHNCKLPVIAHWRANMAVLKTSLPQNGLVINSDPSSTAIPRARCQQADATDIIGCVVASTQCTVGFAGREVGEAAVALQGGQEPLRINQTSATDANVLNALADNGLGAAARTVTNYPFARFLYMSALGGFGNITTDCKARGGSDNYCADEVKLANTFWSGAAATNNVCGSAGFINLPVTQADANGVAQPMRECRGAIVSAGCGQVGKTCTAATDCPTPETCVSGQCTRQDGSKDPADGCQPL